MRVAYGNALLQARGYGAPETTEAFAKARESASVDKDAPGRLSADYGLWTSSYTRGELSSMRAHAAAFLNDAEASPDSPEAGVAHRAAGVTCWFAGEYAQARDHLERALALFQPGRDDDLVFRFGHDAGVGAMLYLAITLWPLGDVTRSIALVESARERLESITHVGTRAQGKCHVALFELMRGDHARATPNAFELVRLAREYNLPFWRASGVFLEGWVTAATGAVGSGLEDMRGGAELLREQNLLWFDGLLKIALAEAETRAGNSDRAIAILDEALATCDRAGFRAFEAELHRARGEMLLGRDPANPAPAEEAFLTAIAVAKQQGTRSFELRAALALAKLYQSTGRPAEAHDCPRARARRLRADVGNARDRRGAGAARGAARRPAAASAQSPIRRSEPVRKVRFASDAADPFVHLDFRSGSMRPFRRARGDCPLLARRRRLELTSSCRSRPPPWTSQVGGKCPYRSSPRQGPESAPKPPFGCEREIAFTALSRHPQPQGHTFSPRNNRPTDSSPNCAQGPPTVSAPSRRSQGAPRSHGSRRQV